MVCQFLNMNPRRQSEVAKIFIVKTATEITVSLFPLLLCTYFANKQLVDLKYGLGICRAVKKLNETVVSLYKLFKSYKRKPKI